MSDNLHYHVSHAQSDNTYYAGNLFSALLCAEDDLRQDTDFAFEGISALGDEGMFEGAYESFKTWQALDNILSNVKNIIFQYQAKESERAPLYQGNGWLSRLNESALHVMGMVNDNTQVFIGPCMSNECMKELEDE
jgi:hypothetical protein